MAGAAVFRAANLGPSTANSVLNPTSLACTKPASTVAGDLLLLITDSRSRTATCATPSGWSLLTGFPVISGTASGGQIYVFTRTADLSATDSPTIVWTGLSTGMAGDSCNSCICAIQNAVPVRDGIATPTDQAATTSWTMPATTTGTDNSIVIAVSVKVSDTSQTTTITNFTEQVDNSTTTGTGHITEISSLAVPTHGSSGTGTVTPSNTTSSRVLAVSFGMLAGTPIPLGASSGVASDSLALSAPTSVPLGASSGAATPTLELSAPTTIALDTSASSSATLAALTAPTQVPLAAASGVLSASLAVTAKTAVPLAAASGAASSSLGLSAATQVPLAAASGAASSTAALTAPTQVSLDASDATASSSAELSAPTFIVGPPLPPPSPDDLPLGDDFSYPDGPLDDPRWTLLYDDPYYSGPAFNGTISGGEYVESQPGVDYTVNQWSTPFPGPVAVWFTVPSGLVANDGAIYVDFRSDLATYYGVTYPYEIYVEDNYWDDFLDALALVDPPHGPSVGPGDGLLFTYDGTRVEGWHRPAGGDWALVGGVNIVDQWGPSYGAGEYVNIWLYSTTGTPVRIDDLHIGAWTGLLPPLVAEGLASPALALSAPAEVILDPADGSASPTLALTAPASIAVATSGNSSATLTVAAMTAVPLGQASASTGATLALSAATRVALAAASASASNALALSAATEIGLGPSSAVASNTLALSAATRLALAAASAQGGASLSLRAAAILALSSSATSSASAVITALSSGQPVILDPVSAVADSSLALTIPHLLALEAASASSSASAQLTARALLSLASAGASSAQLGLSVPIQLALAAASGQSASLLSLRVPASLSLSPSAAVANALVNLTVAQQLTLLAEASGSGTLAIVVGLQRPVFVGEDRVSTLLPHIAAATASREGHSTIVALITRSNVGDHVALSDVEPADSGSKIG